MHNKNSISDKGRMKEPRQSFTQKTFEPIVCYQ